MVRKQRTQRSDAAGLYCLPHIQQVKKRICRNLVVMDLNI